jgi:hypothetical protein
MSESDRIKAAKARIQPELSADGSAWAEVNWPVFGFDPCGTGTRSLSMQIDPYMGTSVTIIMEGVPDQALSATIALVDLERALRIARATLETPPNAPSR